MIKLLIRIFVFPLSMLLVMACGKAFAQQPVKPDTVFITVHDTVYIHDTVWVKDGVVLESNPGWKNLFSPLKNVIAYGKRKHKPEDAEPAVTDYFFRDLVDSMASLAVAFNRDSLAKVILANDSLFSVSWSTQWPYYTIFDLKSISQLSRFELLRGDEAYFFNWFGALNSGFGPRWGIFHQGIDTQLKLGDSLFASFNGIVRYAEFNTGGYGNSNLT